MKTSRNRIAPEILRQLSRKKNVLSEKVRKNAKRLRKTTENENVAQYNRTRYTRSSHARNRINLDRNETSRPRSSSFQLTRFNAGTARRNESTRTMVTSRINPEDVDSRECAGPTAQGYQVLPRRQRNRAERCDAILLHYPGFIYFV